MLLTISLSQGSIGAKIYAGDKLVMTHLILPIVGAKFHPPALGLLNSFPIGQPLELIPEPENKFDPNAIAVWLDGREWQVRRPVPDTIESTICSFGYTSEDIFLDYWHLGYIPKEKAKDLTLSGPVLGKFCVGSNGGPRVEFEI